MPTNPDLKFDEPQPRYSTAARVQDEEGNLFDISVSGPQDMLERFIKGQHVEVTLGPPKSLEEFVESANVGHGEEDVSKGDIRGQQQDAIPPEEKEPPPNHTVRALEIEISTPQTPPDGYTLYLTVDPDIPEGSSHYYSINGASQAWATCQTTVGDADLFLYEVLPDGTWRLRASSSASGTQPDSVSADREATGNWRLRVLGFRASTYSLSGAFNAL